MAETTLTSEDFKIDKEGNIRLVNPEKRDELKRLLEGVEEGETSAETMHPRVNVAI